MRKKKKTGRTHSQRNYPQTRKSLQSIKTSHQIETIQECGNLETGAVIEPLASSTTYSSVLQIPPVMSNPVVSTTILVPTIGTPITHVGFEEETIIYP